MPSPQVIRPRQDFFDSDRYNELTHFLRDHWERAKTARSGQVDEKMATWQKNYEGVPKEKRRLLPWPGASNFVVQLIRMYVDTFVARSLNIIFATRPLFTLDFLPHDIRDSVEMYLNRKAMHDWNYYDLTRNMLQRGAKNGTCVTKTTYDVVEEISVSSGPNGEMQENDIIIYDGPRSEAISFDDFYVYPITAEKLENLTIKFHKIRYVEEEARRLQRKWQLTDEQLEAALHVPVDVKRDQEQEDAGVHDPWLREMEIIECHLKFELEPFSNRYYSIIALLEPSQGILVDVYYNPLVRNMEIFRDYKPLPREDMFFGESWAQVLQQAQEEASTIHNDRRNNSYIANSPIFKRKSGSLLPNPSSNWYPSKVFDLESMDDFEIVMVGRNYNNMLEEENHVFMLAERIIGIGALQQGNASGMMGKRGIYNAAGTLAVLSESNQRQDTNIRDIRQVLGDIARKSFTLQSHYGTNDPLIDMYPPQVAAQIRQGLEMAITSTELLPRSFFEIKASDAGANKEVNKANLIQMAQIIAQYGASLPQMTTAILGTKNPVLQRILTDVAKMHRSMAKKILRVFDEFEQAEELPDIISALRGGEVGNGGGIAQGQPGGPQNLLGGGAGPADQAAARQTLESVASLPTVA